MSSLLINLTALGGAPTVDDLLYIVDDPSGTPVDRKMTIAELFTSPQVLTPTFIVSDAATNTPSTVITMLHATSGVAAVGFGIQQLFQLDDDAGTPQQAGALIFQWNDAQAASFSGDFIIDLTGNGGTGNYPLHAAVSAAGILRVALGNTPGTTPTGSTVDVIGNAGITTLRAIGAGGADVVGIFEGGAAQSGNLAQFNASGGAVQARITFDGGAVFNEAGTATGDVRIEGDTNANLFFCHASADRIGIGTNTPQRPLHVIADTNGIPLRLEANSGGNYIELVIGTVQARWDISAAIPFIITQGGAATERLTIDGSGNVTWNDIGASVDFRVEGDTDVNLLFCDGSADTVQVGAATTADSAKFYVSGKFSCSGEAEINGDLNHDGTNVGFYAVAPVARATTAIAEAAFVENAGGAVVNVDSTVGGYTLQQVVQALQDIGILT